VKDHPDDHLAERFDAMSDRDKIDFMIETNGWALEAIQPDAESTPPTPGYAYTIGLTADVGFPEVAVFGLTPAASKGLLTLVADACRGGTEIPIGVEVVGLLDNELRCLFAPIDLAPWGPYFATAAAWYDGRPFEMVQLMYPDRNGFMPYETGYEQRMALAQPVIGTIA
jgi:hypothetical protein